MRPALTSLKTFVKHPLTQLVVGLVLLVSGAMEIIVDFRSAERSFSLGAHHGVALFGLIQVLGSLPELVHGLEHTIDAAEKRQVR